MPRTRIDMKYIYSLLLAFLAWGGYSIVAAQDVHKDLLFEWDRAVCENTCVNGVDGYRVYTEQGSLIADVYTEQYLAVSYSLTVGVEVGFYVTAYNEDGESVPSNIAFVKVDSSAPSSTILRVTIQ